MEAARHGAGAAETRDTSKSTVAPVGALWVPPRGFFFGGGLAGFDGWMAGWLEFQT